MKSSNRFALLATVVVALSSLSTAALAATATGNASATVITPITITTGATLNFGTFAPSATAGTIAISTTGVRSASNVAPSGAGTAFGTFTVGGANVGFSIAAPATFSVTGPGPAMVVTLSGLGNGAGTTGTISGGSVIVPFGGSMAVGTSAVQTAGAYSGTFSMVVEYN